MIQERLIAEDGCGGGRRPRDLLGVIADHGIDPSFRSAVPGARLTGLCQLVSVLEIRYLPRG